MSLPVLKIQPVSQFTEIASSPTNGAVGIWRPTVDPGWFYFGDYCQPNGALPETPGYAVQIENDDPNNPALMPPIDWTVITANGEFSLPNGYINIWYSWLHVPPQNYVACGHVATTSPTFGPPPTTPSIPNFRCLRADLAKSYTLSTMLWNDQGGPFPDDTALWAISPLNTFFAEPNNPDSSTFVPIQQIPQR